jgi:hypothetical protein
MELDKAIECDEFDKVVNKMIKLGQKGFKVGDSIIFGQELFFQVMNNQEISALLSEVEFMQSTKTVIGISYCKDKKVNMLKINVDKANVSVEVREDDAIAGDVMLIYRKDTGIPNVDKYLKDV